MSEGTQANGCAGVFFSLTHHIFLELINLSLLLLHCTCDGSRDGLDLLSEGAFTQRRTLSGLNASVASSTQKWENHTLHELRTGKFCFGVAINGFTSGRSKS